MQKNIKTFTINQLLFVQAHFGNKTSKWNPLIKSFLFGSRHGVHFFDLKLVMPYLKRVLFFLTKATTNHQILLFIGAHPFVSVLIQFLAINTKQSSISRKWVAGTLTNWLRIKPYVRFLYRTNITQIRKKFILRTEKKIEQKIIQYLKMKYLLSGIERMPSIPNILILLEKEKESYPLLESFKLMIPVISIINTGPQSGGKVSYPVFGNDFLFDSLFFFGNLFLQAVKEGVLKRRLLFLQRFWFPSLKLRSQFLKLPNEKILLKNFKIFFRIYKNYKTLALKRIIRKSMYLTL
jgi:small subunit ribosomal protein S2